MPKTQMDKTGTLIIKICIFSIILSLTALFLSAVFHFKIYKGDKPTAKYGNYPLIIIDAGHGGEDGGAVSKDGIKEKDLNLAIAQKIGQILKSSGYNVLLTRENDQLLYTEYKKGSLKMQDLRNRLNIANSNENCIFLSIHMNKFSQEKYCGTQIFYSKNKSESNKLANVLQANIKKHLQPENRRETKAVGSSIFLLNNIKSTAVLIECGFLSNQEECSKLTSTDYQKELSTVISTSVIEFLNTM